MEPKGGSNFQVVDKRRSHDAEGAARRPISPDQRAHSVLLGYLSEEQARRYLEAKGIQPDLLDELLRERERAQARIQTLAPPTQTSCASLSLKENTFFPAATTVYRLMKAGFSHGPCIVREASTFAQTGAYGPGLFSDEMPMVPRPPLFPDIADPVLGIISPFRAVQRVIRIRPDEDFVYR